jgi:hypothetical protein
MSVRDPFWDVARLVVTVITVLVAGWAIAQATDFRPLAAYFPLAAAAMIVLFGTIQLAIDVRNFAKGRAVVIPGLDVESPIHGRGFAGLVPALKYMGWFVGFALAFWLAGIFVASLLFMVAFLRIEARWGWVAVGVAAVGMTGAALVMVRGLGLALPRSVFDLGYSLLL